MIRLLGMEALPVLGLVLGGGRSQVGKVRIEKGGSSHGKTNRKGLVSGVVQLSGSAEKDHEKNVCS